MICKQVLRTICQKVGNSCHHTPLSQLVGEPLCDSGQVDVAKRLRCIKTQDVRQGCLLHDLDKWSLQLLRSKATQQLQANTNLLGCSPPAYRSACNYPLTCDLGLLCRLPRQS